MDAFIIPALTVLAPASAAATLAFVALHVRNSRPRRRKGL